MIFFLEILNLLFTPSPWSRSGDGLSRTTNTQRRAPVMAPTPTLGRLVWATDLVMLCLGA